MGHRALPILGQTGHQAIGRYTLNRLTGLVNVRRMVQLLFLFAWFALFLLTRHQLTDQVRIDLFLVTDPLVAALTMGASTVIVPSLILSVFWVVFTLLFGRAFCGWVCPLGTLIDGAAKVLHPPEQRFSMRTHLKLQHLKYAVLVIMVFGSLASAQWVYLLDPLVLLFRGMTAGFYPMLNGILPAPMFPGETGMDYHGVAFAPAALLFSSIAVTAVTPRFYCRYVCPLGAFLGLLSRVPLLRRRVSGCDACTTKGGKEVDKGADKECISGCRMGAVPSNPHYTQNHECIRCMSGRSFCHKEAIRFDWQKPSEPNVRDVQVDYSRRSFLVLSASGASMAPLAAMSAFHRTERNAVIRPPRVLSEEVFVDQCIRCAMCVQACPTQTLQLTHLESGVAGFWTPAVTASVGGCIAECNACSVACPTDAIPVFAKNEADKWSVKMGTVVLEKNRCICFTENEKCAECITVCPTDAFKIEEAHDAIPRRPTAVDYFRCVGCGLCEEACRNIVFGTPALLTFAHGQGEPTSLRELPTSELRARAPAKSG